MYTFPVFGCWGNLVGSTPSTPLLTLTDQEDGTGFTAEIGGQDDGTTNTLYVGEVGEDFASEGSDWDSLDQMDVGVTAGRLFAYVVSFNGSQSVVSEVETVVVTGDTPTAATDNVPVAVRAMKQTAVLWPVSDVDEFGRPDYDAPVEIGCRWEAVQEEFITPEGDRELSRAKLIVDRDVDVKSMLYLGDLDDVVDPDDPRNNDGAWEARQFKKTPNFRGTKFLREVYL